MLIQHIQATPVPPSIRSGRPVPADLERIIMRCLEKKPEARFDTADDLAAALEDTAAANAWGVDEAKAWWEEHVSVPVPARVSSSAGVLAVG
jgi:eukaryotic-like serine/threonine-protein kinase